MRNATWCVIAVAALTAAGCGSKGSAYQPKPVKKISPAAIKAGEELDLMPFVVGNQWVYEFTATVTNPRGQQQRQQGTVVYQVKDVKPNASGDGRVAVIEVRAENTGQVGDRQVWEVNKKGLFQRSVSLKNTPFTPMLPAITFPADSGKTFSWSGSGIIGRNVVGKSTIKNTILPSQEIDAAGARMSAIPVESITNYADKKRGVSRSLAFFTPGIGIVRYRQETAAPTGRIEQMLVLKRHVVKTK